MNMEQNECIADLLFRSKLRLDNPGACAREYNSIMQIVMECLIGWNFNLKKQTSYGIFGKVFGWCDTTEAQARFTLHCFTHLSLYYGQIVKRLGKRHKRNLLNSLKTWLHPWNSIITLKHSRWWQQSRPLWKWWTTNYGWTRSNQSSNML